MFVKTRKNHKKSGFTPHMRSGGTPPEGKARRTNLCEGFTLLEMLVVLGIFVVMSTIVLVKNQQFNNVILLDSVAYDVALTIREAQISGLSAVEDPAGGELFNFAYGVRFHIVESTTEYHFFIDRNGDRTAGDFDTSDEILKRFNLKRGFEISRICAVVSGIEECSDSSGLVAMNATFLRPDPDAYINTNLGVASQMTIYISSPDGTESSITTTNTGQISID